MVVELGDWLLRTAFALGIVIAVVMALRPLWRRVLGSSGVLWLWLLVPAALVATSWPRPSVVVEFAVASAEATPAEVAPVLESVATMTSAEVAPVLESVALMPTAFAPPIGWTGLLFLTWFLGSLWMLLRLVGQQRDFLRRLGALTRRDDGSYLASTRRIGPAVVGALRPRIVLPADFESRYDAPQQALVLAHERHHLRRGDLQVNLLASALRCVFWFNPLVHLAATRLRVDQELACDAAVLRKNPDAGRAYATALLNTQLADLGLPVGCYWQSSQSLKWRIAMLKRPSPGTARLLAGATLALFASSAAAVSLWQVQPITTVAVPAAATPSALAAPAATPQVLAQVPITLPLPVVDLPPIAPASSAVSALVVTGQETDAVILVRPAAQSPAAQGSPPDVDAKAEVLPPRVVTYVDAWEPYRRSRKPEGGYVVVVANIGSDGRLLSASVPDESVTPVYRTQALSALEHWTFEPARRGDAAVAATIAVPVHFSPKREPTLIQNGIDPPGLVLGRPYARQVQVESALSQAR